MGKVSTCTHLFPDFGPRTYLQGVCVCPLLMKRRAQLSRGSTAPKQEIPGCIGKLAKHEPESEPPL